MICPTIQPTSNLFRPATWLALGFAFVLSGCIGPISPSFYTDSVSLQVDSDANQTSATAVDLIAVYDENLLKTVMAMNAEKYFESIQQIKRDFPQAIEVFHWEVVPGRSVNFEKLRYKKTSPLGAVIFARFIAPGDHRKVIGTQENLVIHLMRDGFETYEEKSYDPIIEYHKESE